MDACRADGKSPGLVGGARDLNEAVARDPVDISTGLAVRDTGLPAAPSRPHRQGGAMSGGLNREFLSMPV